MFDFENGINRCNTSSIKWDRRQNGDDEIVTPFWIADSDWGAPPCVVSALIERALHPVYGYTYANARYYDSICDWFRRRAHWQIQREWILPGIGVMPSMCMILEELTKPGDRVIAMSPVYDPFFMAIRGTGRIVAEVPLKEHELHYAMDYELLEEEMKNGASAVLLCNPHNPVSRVWSVDELERLVSLCEEYGVYLISDDSHCDLVGRNHPYIPVASLQKAENRIVTLTAPSKTFNVAGIGSSNVIVKDSQLRDRIQNCFMNHLIRGSNIFAYTVCCAGYGEGEAWLDEQLAYLEDNVKYFQEFLSGNISEIKMTPWEGTYLIWLDCRAWEKSSEELVDLLKEKFYVSVSNGADYGKQADGFLRVNLACPRRNIDILCKALSDASSFLIQKR